LIPFAPAQRSNNLNLLTYALETLQRGYFLFKAAVDEIGWVSNKQKVMENHAMLI
jgi:hypothetical protein